MSKTNVTDAAEPADLKRLRLKRAHLKATITRIENFIKDPVALASAERGMLQARKDKLVSTLKEYEEINLDILAVDENDVEDVSVIENKYFALLSKLNESLKVLLNRETSQNSNVSDSKLPNIEISSFNGKDFTKYKPFMDIFTAIIDNNKTLSNVQKLFYLRKYLTEDALSVIINLPIVNESYPEALNLLKKRFDNETRLITNHINNLLDLPQMQKGTAVALRSFVSEVQQQIYALKNLKQPTQNWDMLLISILSRKLDSYTNRAYHLDRVDVDKLPTLTDFLIFLEKRAIALEDSPPQKGTSYESPVKFKTPYKVSNFTMNPKVKQTLCVYCDKTDHPIFMCPKFKMAAVEDRLLCVDSKKLCKLCLKPHEGKCGYHFKCKICRQNHNTLLHREDSSKEPIVTLHSNNNIDDNILLPTVKVKVFDKFGKEIYLKALLDSGSQASIINKSVLENLNLKPMAQNTNIVGIGNNPNKVTQYVNVMVHSCVHNVKLDVKCFVVDSITSKIPQYYFDYSRFRIPENIKLADTSFNVPSDISLLLGADIYFKVLLDGCIKFPDGPVLQNTLFGHVVGGNINCLQKTLGTSTTLVSNFVMNENYINSDLNKIMENFWLSEKIPEGKNKINSEFIQAENIFKNSVLLKDQRFQVDMPLKKPIQQLEIGDSFSIALQRFFILENKFKNNPDYFQRYKSFIDEYLKLGHAKIVDIDQYDVYNDSVYFLSHFAVLNDSSKTTKLRVVFNGSLKSKSNVSLNDVMLNGPPVQNELFDILILFRTYRYTLMCDIEKMFRQIFINTKQAPLQNILWRDDPHKPILCLQLQTVTYGLKASTFLSTRCLVELAIKNKDTYPLAAKAILQNTYVDDVICGSDDISELQNLKLQLIELLKLGSFNLHKWCSNSDKILNEIPINQRFFENIDISKDNIIKTLGLKYNVLSDSFIFISPSINIEEVKSKRDVLSFIGRIYDPLGFLGPVIVKAKLFMQELWHIKIDWDSKLPPKQLETWIKIVSHLCDMEKIQIPRGIVSSDMVSLELVGYCDASFSAIGCCLYLRVFCSNGTVDVNLLCSKSRIAPLNKTLTIPNLELNSAVLLAQLANRVFQTLRVRFPFRVKLNTDSKVVLCWLNSSDKKGTYVSNRVNQIKQLTKDFQWCYVKSADNPADLVSRGCSPQKLHENRLWFHGPSYLSSHDFKFDFNEKCIMNPILEKVDTENKSSLIISQPGNLQSDQHLDIFKRYADINKLQRILALILRFKHNCQNSHNKIHGFLSPQELNNSFLYIIRHIQKAYFQAEINLINANKPVKTGLSSLHPFLDKNKVLRVGGRLQNANNITYEKMHPIILPKSNFVTTMIIQREHLRLLHAGAKLVLSSLSQVFWLINGIREVKKVLHKCVKCFRNKAVAAKQLMGSLPTPRITPSRPFQVTGVDFCGPFDIKVARVRNPMIKKSYIALFVCFSTKAVHVELVSDLCTKTFLACLNRFISRRGMPSMIYCDNAATFKGASNILNDLYAFHNSKSNIDSINTFCSNKLIKFKYIPGYSPEFGGLWEAGVKAVKYHLKRILGKVVLTYEELYTVITQIEAILNSRPLLPFSSDISDFTYLTPGHLLIGAPLCSYPETDVTNVNINRLKFWEMCVKLKQDFWKVWSKDYLTQLQNRPKWKYDNVNLKEGDLVIVRMKDVAPMDWPMGRIIKTFPGADNKVRVAEVKMGHNKKSYIRSYTKLCPLPITDKFDII